MNFPNGSNVSPFAFESKIFRGYPSLMLSTHILESVPHVTKWRLSGAHVKSIIAGVRAKLTLMIAPYFFCLPIFADFHFILLNLFLCFEIFLADREADTISIVENLLATRYVLDALILPENCATIVTSRCEESANWIPSDTVYRLLVVT